MNNIIIYISNWHSIGGVETFVKNFCKRMGKHYDITVLFDYNQNINTLIEVSEFVNTAKIKRNKIYKCDVYISASAWGVNPINQIQANYYIQMIHACYDYFFANMDFAYKKNEQITHHVCVSETVKKSFEKATKYKCDAVIYNLLDNALKELKKPKNNILTLVTVSRISKEKGFNRMLQLADLLNKENINYIWNVYGDTSYAGEIIKKFAKYKNIKFKGITHEAFKIINDADYLVQLSDTEGFAYSVYEALQVKTPCLITPFESGKEQIKDGINGYILPFDMKNINLTKIISKIPKIKEFNEVNNEETWINFITKIKKNDNSKNKKAN